MMSEQLSYFHERAFEPPLRAQILEEVCKRMGLRLEILQPREGFLYRIWDGDRFINHQLNVCTLNRYDAGLIAKDKTYTYLILQHAGFHVPRGDYFFRRGLFRAPDYSIGRSEEDAAIYGIQLGMACSMVEAKQYLSVNKAPRFEKEVIVKPNSLSHGKGVFRVDTVEALEFAIKKVFELPTDTERIVIVQEYVNGSEFRLIMLDGELLLCAGKDFGDGTRAVMRDRTSEVTHQYLQWARRASHAMQMRYIGLDFKCESLESSTSDAVILEVNCNPGLTYYFEHDMKRQALSIYEKLITEMFKGAAFG